ncbi:MAG: hypothetical protein OEZ43_17780 [Gammaproteobacteria bacterium]|nr:hypothetical protein [Gammaproteobacteria bacterium]
MLHNRFSPVLFIVFLVACADNDSTTSKLHGTWVTDFSALGHEGHSHSTFNSDGTYKLDMEFVVAGSDCFLDVTTTGTYVASATTLTITHVSGTKAVTHCTETTYNHEERAMTDEEITGYNATGELTWSVIDNVLTLTDGSNVNRTYSLLVGDPAEELYDKWVTDLTPLGHDGYSHSTFNSDGTYELDMEFIVAGSDCFLDVITSGTFVASPTTITITHESGTRAVSQCSDTTNNHAERALTDVELDSYNATGKMRWSVENGVLTLSDGVNLNRTYTRHVSN